MCGDVILPFLVYSGAILLWYWSCTDKIYSSDECKAYRLSDYLTKTCDTKSTWPQKPRPSPAPRAHSAMSARSGLGCGNHDQKLPHVFGESNGTYHSMAEVFVRLGGGL